MATPTWSTTHSYGSALPPTHRPHTARSSQPVPTHRVGTASGCAAATDDGFGASASTCSTCHRPCTDAHAATVLRGCDTVRAAAIVPAGAHRHVGTLVPQKMGRSSHDVPGTIRARLDDMKGMTSQHTPTRLRRARTAGVAVAVGLLALGAVACGDDSIRLRRHGGSHRGRHRVGDRTGGRGRHHRPVGTHQPRRRRQRRRLPHHHQPDRRQADRRDGRCRRWPSMAEMHETVMASSTDGRWAATPPWRWAATPRWPWARRDDHAARSSSSS